MMIPITSKENQNIKNYIRYSDDKKKRNSDGVFTMEGLKLIREAHEENIQLQYAFLTPSFIKKHQESGLLFLDNQTISYEISEELAQKMSNTKTPQGIFAIAKKIDKPLLLDTIYSNGKYLALHHVSDPGNLGTIIRTADALGMDGLILSNDCCDIYSPKVIRATMGSLFRLPIAEYADFGGLIHSLNDNGVCTLASSVESKACSLREYCFPDKTVLFIGNEANGLPKEIAARCSDTITIPMRLQTESLNAAMAAGIFMWEMLK